MVEPPNDGTNHNQNNNNNNNDRGRFTKTSPPPGCSRRFDNCLSRLERWNTPLCCRCRKLVSLGNRRYLLLRDVLLGCYGRSHQALSDLGGGPSPSRIPT